MSAVLCIGVIDIPHREESFEGAGNSVSTGELAQFLENKYALFSQFADLNLDAIESALADSLDGALSNVLAGGPLAENPYAEGDQKITALFRTFLDTEGMVKSGVPGVPTEAALKGVNHRLKQRQGPRRPSFIDTGILRDSLQTWTESE